MTRTTRIIIATAVIVLSAASASFAGATDGSRQAVSPPIWLERKPPETRPYSLTGDRALYPNRESGRRKCELQHLGNKVQTEVCRRELY